MSASLLEIRDLTVCYGGIQALHGISLSVPQGSIVTLIGANGAGKSTTLRTVSGLVTPSAGSICFDGMEISGQPAHRIVAAGLAHVPEGRLVFPELSVKENLRMGAYLRRDRKGIADDLEWVCEFFPRLKERLTQQAGTLSGGEQQMLAIGRALMGRPRCLMLDEPSLGIAPLLTETIFTRLVDLNRERGMTMLLVEQNASLALRVSHYAYVLESGRIHLEGPSAEIRKRPEVKTAYLGH
ncbi:MAG: ABC transporter ATP-binding protein [Proteobacteria bacterium]|jgi:branched-chain amino acid transport system ATP-binding protein|nr:ABC transporter ATP-binding protein [Pseudomonadota bacterium]